MAGEWAEAKLGNVTHRVTKGTTPTTVGGRFVDSGIAFVKVESITEDGRLDTRKFAYIDDQTHALLARSMLQEDDVLFTIAGTIGRVAKVPLSILPANTNQAVAIIRPNRDLIDPRFLYYVMRDEQRVRHAHTRTVQSVQANFSLTELSEIQIPLPEKNEQCAIARILGTLDDKIELNRRMNETMEAMVRAIFRSWFVDFDPVRAKAEGRDPDLPKAFADLFPGAFEDSELGEIPKGWRVVAAADLAEINARTLGRTDPLDVIDYVEISEVMRGDIANIVRYERGTEPSRARRRLTHGDTVISTVRPDRGAYFLCLNPPETLIASTGFAVVTPRDGNWAFLYAALTRREVGEELGRLADGGAYPAVRPEAVGRFYAVVPPTSDIRAAFEKLARPLFERSAQNRMEAGTLAALRDTLLPKLISGELRVPDAERIVRQSNVVQYASPSQ